MAAAGTERFRVIPLVPAQDPRADIQPDESDRTDEQNDTAHIRLLDSPNGFDQPDGDVVEISESLTRQSEQPSADLERRDQQKDPPTDENQSQ